jgi:hypothetical protein
MKKLHLLGTVTAGLIFTAGAAAAQETQRPQGRTPDRAPAAQQSAPSERMGPSTQPSERGQSGQSIERGQRSQSETTGQMRNEQPSDRGQGREQGRGRGQSETTGQMRNEQPSDRGQGREQGRGRDQSETRGQMRNESPSDRDQMERRGQMRDQMRERLDERRGGANIEREGRGGQDGRTTGQGAAGAVRLSDDQRSRITTYFRQHREARPATLNVPLRVGVRVPTNVRFYPLPTQIVDIYPDWRGYDYIEVAGRILVVDPDTHEIVAILDI